ncbi:MAG: LemA family protein [Taibaiella sp.]|nr:LemA family protein [Taibaiella sp.]
MKNLLIIIGILLVIVMMGGCSYNGMNQARGNVDQSWAEVQSSYQRRSDLIPNLVATVKGSADFERGTLEAVVNARAKATSLTVNASDLTQEKLQQIQQSQGQLSMALGRLLVASERYPDLQSTQGFRDLQVQLEGTENRIKVARDNYNANVKIYNVKITNFPQNLFAGVFGFKTRPWFQADPAAQNAPKVQF